MASKIADRPESYDPKYIVDTKRFQAHRDDDNKLVVDTREGSLSKYKVNEDGKEQIQEVAQYNDEYELADALRKNQVFAWHGPTETTTQRGQPSGPPSPFLSRFLVEAGGVCAFAGLYAALYDVRIETVAQYGFFRDFALVVQPEQVVIEGAHSRLTA